MGSVRPVRQLSAGQSLPSGAAGVTQALLYPLSLYSSIFVEPATPPGWLQAFVDVNPVTHLIAAARELIAGGVPNRRLAWILITRTVLTAVFAPLLASR